MATHKCPVCESKPKSWTENPHGRDANAYDCPNCGMYVITGTALAMLPNITYVEKAALSYQIWLNRGTSGTYEINFEHIRRVYLADLPSPEEQLENLITFWGDEQGQHLGSEIEMSWPDLRAKLGAITPGDVDFVAEEAIRRGLLKGNSRDQHVTGVLTFRGWDEFRRIQRGQGNSRHAFMAMPFGNPEITKFVDDVFRPAVEETGFTLKRLDDAPEAGIIDNRMRVEIRQCKFLVADLTHENRGAYWEAGFAEGLGKHVIYTCEKAYFDEYKTHFDTNHCTTVVWDSLNPSVATETLKATIRNTFPFEAKLPNDSGS